MNTKTAENPFSDYEEHKVTRAYLKIVRKNGKRISSFEMLKVLEGLTFINSNVRHLGNHVIKFNSATKAYPNFEKRSESKLYLITLNLKGCRTIFDKKAIVASLLQMESIKALKLEIALIPEHANDDYRSKLNDSHSLYQNWYRDNGVCVGDRMNENNKTKLYVFYLIITNACNDGGLDLIYSIQNVRGVRKVDTIKKKYIDNPHTMEKFYQVDYKVEMLMKEGNDFSEYDEIKSKLNEDDLVHEVDICVSDIQYLEKTKVYNDLYDFNKKKEVSKTEPLDIKPKSNISLSRNTIVKITVGAMVLYSFVNSIMSSF